jgi:hypothetical protein
MFLILVDGVFDFLVDVFGVSSDVFDCNHCASFKQKKADPS